MKLLLTSMLLFLAFGAAHPPRGEVGRRGDEFSKLKVKLRSGDKWDRKRAVEKLVKLGTNEAWECVIEALEDHAGEVADTAQLLLAGLPDGKALDALLGREGLDARDEWVRQRSAEVLARVEVPVDGVRLARALSDRDPDVRWNVLWTLERLANSERLQGDRGRWILPPVRRLAARDGDPEVQGRALLTLAALDPEGAREAVRAALAERAAPVRCAAVSLVPTLFAAAEAVPLLAARVADSSLVVRTRVVESLAAVGTVEAVRLLVARLDAEKEVRLGWRIVETLQRVTGRKYRRDPRPWLRFVEGLPGDWAPPPVAEGDGEPAALGEDRSRAFAGMPLLSGRVAFLIDLSGSIWIVRKDGTTRKEVLDGKLRDALAGLDPASLFNVIPFTSEPHPWKDELVRATPANVERATRYFEDCRAQGSGNVWDAIALALADPAVDTVVILTDGAPTGGRRHRLELMIPLLEQRNATRMVAVDSILVGAPPKLQRYWADLSRRTGGRMVAIEL